MPLQVQQVKPKQVWQKYTNLWFTEKKRRINMFRCLQVFQEAGGVAK